jgi:hypothetical protein
VAGSPEPSWALSRIAVQKVQAPPADEAAPVDAARAGRVGSARGSERGSNEFGSGSGAGRAEYPDQRDQRDEARLRRGRRVESPDEVLVRALYAEHGPAIRHLALRKLGDRGDAEDLVQETFLRAWRHPEVLIRQPSAVRAWLGNRGPQYRRRPAPAPYRPAAGDQRRRPGRRHLDHPHPGLRRTGSPPRSPSTRPSRPCHPTTATSWRRCTSVGAASRKPRRRCSCDPAP